MQIGTSYKHKTLSAYKQETKWPVNTGPQHTMYQRIPAQYVPRHHGTVCTKAARHSMYHGTITQYVPRHHDKVCTKERWHSVYQHIMAQYVPNQGTIKQYVPKHHNTVCTKAALHSIIPRQDKHLQFVMVSYDLFAFYHMSAHSKWMSFLNSPPHCLEQPFFS